MGCRRCGHLLFVLLAVVLAAAPYALQPAAALGRGSTTGQIKATEMVLPDISRVQASIRYIWPVDVHNMVNVSLSGARDPFGAPVTIKILNVTSNQPTTSYNDPLCPDADITTDSSWVLLRAERLNNTARVYRILYSATTTRNTTARGTAQVCVPVHKPAMEKMLHACSIAAKLILYWDASQCVTPDQPVQKLATAPSKWQQEVKERLGAALKPPTEQTQEQQQQQEVKERLGAALKPPTQQQQQPPKEEKHYHNQSPTDLIPFLRLTFNHIKCYQVDYNSPAFLKNVTQIAGELVEYSSGKASQVAVVKDGVDADCQENHLDSTVSVNFPLVIMAVGPGDGNVLSTIINNTDQGRLYSAWCGAGGRHAANCADWNLKNAAVVLDYGKPVQIASSAIGPIVVAD